MRAQGGWGKHKELPRTPPSHRANTKQHRAGIVSEASGQCEVLAKCEWTLKLPQNAETGAPRVDANDGEKAGVKLGKMLK